MITTLVAANVISVWLKTFLEALTLQEWLEVCKIITQILHI
jgi:hypothetical protein